MSSYAEKQENTTHNEDKKIIWTDPKITQLTEFVVEEKHNYNLTGYVQETRGKIKHVK